MSGPTQFIRENCPIATPRNDGLMSQDMATQLARGGGGTFLWSTDKTWTQLWAEVQAAGGFGIILVDPNVPAGSPSLVISDGSYDFSNILFKMMPRYGFNNGQVNVTLDTGVRIDAGTTVGLHLDGPLVFRASAALMSSSSKQVALTFKDNALLRQTADVVLFDTTLPSASGQHVVRTTNSAGLLAAGGGSNPVIYLNSATGVLSLEVRGVGFNGQCFSGGGTFGAAIGGLAGSAVVYYNDPNAFVSPSDVASPTTFTLTNAYPLTAQRVTALPTASVTFRGRIARIEGGGGVADTAHICLKNADGSYSWIQFATGT